MDYNLELRESPPLSAAPGDALHHYSSYSYSNSQDGTGAYSSYSYLNSSVGEVTLGFQGYVVSTEEPFLGFHHIVIAYCLLAFVLMYPFVVCGRYYRDNIRTNSQEKKQETRSGTPSPPGSEVMAEHNVSNLSAREGGPDAADPMHLPEESAVDPITPTTTKSSVEEDTDVPISESLPAPAIGSSSTPAVPAGQQRRPQGSQVTSSSGIASRIPSAATTGLLYGASKRGRPSAAWPRHKHSGRPTGVPSWQWKRAIQAERRHFSRRMEQQSQSSGSMLWRLKSTAAGAMSDLANAALDAEQKTEPHSNNVLKMEPFSGMEGSLYSRRARRRQRNHSNLSFASSGRSGYPPSVMSSIVDDITPNDAADANDPGKVKAFHTPDPIPRTKTAAALSAIEPWLDVAEPNDELVRLAGLAFPMTLGALLDPVSRCILIGVISHWAGTHATVAYLLVQLLYRLTGETLSVAITDAESTLVQMALTENAKSNPDSGNNNNASSSFSKEGYRQAGQYVQLACWLQLFLVGPVLVIWYFFMEDAVRWWVGSSDMALLAKEYFQVVVFLFLIQALYRAIMVPCHIRGVTNAFVETLIDVLTTAATLVTITLVLSKISDDVDENDVDDAYTSSQLQNNSKKAMITVGWIQVNIGAAACILKLAFCILKGWLDHFRVLRTFALLNFSAFCNLLLTSIPLVIGSVLEFGEVDLLTIFVRQLGVAEVAAWAIIGSIWDVLQASTEGISEAAAIRVAFHLSSSQPGMAKKLSRKVLFWCAVESLILSSALLLTGRKFIVALTVDYTIQHLLDDLLGLLSLANLALGFGQVCWSLLGAQGRYNLATLLVLACRWIVTMPLALIFIYALNYDEESLSGAVAVGSATSTCALAFVLLSSNWNEVAHDLFVQGLLNYEDNDDFDFSFGDEDESSDGSSFGFGDFQETKQKPMKVDYGHNNAPQHTEPTARTNTGSHSGNSGLQSGHSGMHSGHSGMHSGHSGMHNGRSGIQVGGDNSKDIET